MKGFGKRAGILVICVLMLFTAACGSKEGENTGVAMGRYVEAVMNGPDTRPMGQFLRSDGTIDVYGYNAEGILSRFHTADGITWSEESFDSTDEDLWERGASILQMAYDKDDTLYLLSREMIPSEDPAMGLQAGNGVYKVLADGSLETCDIKWEGSDSDSRTGAYYLDVADNGDFFIAQDDGMKRAGVYQYDSGGDFIRHYSCEADLEMRDGPGGGSGYLTLIENTLYLSDSKSGVVLVYNILDGTLLQSIPFENYSGYTTIAGGNNGAIYLMNRGGVYRLLSGGSVWEKLIEGELTTLALPTLYFGYLLELEDGTLYMLGQGDVEAKLYRFRYEENVPVRPTYELTVYTLEENDFVRQAAGEYQRQYPDTKVNIQIGSAGGSTTKSDLIRALNTELLAGKGPDVLILDGMPVESFIEKGALEEITTLVDQTSRGEETLMESVVRAYEKENKLYAAATKFIVPVMFGEEETLRQITDLESAASFAQHNQERGLSSDLRPEALQKAFMPVSAPAFLKGGRIDEVELRTFLESVKAISNVSAASYPRTEQWEYDFYGHGESAHYAYGRCHVLLLPLKSTDEFMQAGIAMEQRDSGKIAYFPGLSSKVFIPVNIAGVNANSMQKERAMDFIRILLSEDVQSSKIEDGFPVNVKTLEHLIKDPINSFAIIGFIGEDFTGVEDAISGEYPSTEYQQQLLELMLAVEVPYTVDEILTDLIIGEAEGYFTEEKTIEQAIADIKERTKLYLSE